MAGIKKKIVICTQLTERVKKHWPVDYLISYGGFSRARSGFFLILILFWGIQTAAQQRSCGLHERYDTAQLTQFTKKNTPSRLNVDNGLKLNSRSNHYIPLVFHIMLEEGRSPVTLNEIQDQIEVLNETFNAINPDLAYLPKDFRPFSANTGIQFCLAYTDHGIGPEPAIEQKSTELPYFGEQVNLQGKLLIKHEILGGFDAWNTQKYINIWISELSAYQGFATLPGEGPSDEAGIVIDPDFFGFHPNDHEKYPFNLGKTLVHEMGHYFGLLHPWGSEETCDSDDGIEDTPVQGKIYYGCPKHPQYSCGSADMYMNFMNYTDDNCLIFFTEGQKSRMWQMIDLYYPDLMRDQFCRDFDSGDSPVDDIWILYQAAPPALKLKRFTPAQSIVRYRLMDAAGRTVLSGSFYGESEKDIYLNNIAAGVYILFLQDEKKFVSRKFVFL
ncbi:MAG TPA: hypothetical protein DCQ58_12005 [Saprospirales bacterium]|nr:hypothetical protein [Saprospirales bacterium]